MLYLHNKTAEFPGFFLHLSYSAAAGKKSQQTLAIISKKMYGDVSHVDAISRMNGLQNGNLIYIGQKLILP